MKTRKPKAAKAESVKTKVPSDVFPSTSLPPLVESQLRCFLRVTISQVLWTVHKPPSSTFIRLRWLGELSNGTHFFPRDGSQLSQKTIKTTARFPIRCGPKQFTSYLTDMGSLVLEVLTKQAHLPIAQARVEGIARLSLTQPISGFYTFVSPTSEKLGELQVSLNLEPLTEEYNSSSGPTTDINMEEPQVTALTVPSQPRPLSAGSGKESAGSNSGSTPRGRDHLYFPNPQKNKDESLENLMPKTNTSHNHQTALNPSSQEPSGHPTSDMLSVILERGNKLRNALVVSALKSDMDSAAALKDAPLPLPRDNVLPHSNRLLSSPTGTFLQNILNADLALKPPEAAAVISDCLDCPADMENRAVDLLLGGINSSQIPLWDEEEPFYEPLSDHYTVCEDSELNDPQYDQSLLENLFYKTPMSEVRESDTEDKGQERVSLSKKRLTPSEPKKRRGPNSEPQQSMEAGGLPPGLSSEQMALLSLIHWMKVTVNSMTVPTDTKPGKSSNKYKSPRTLTSKKCTYFIEYKFPVDSTSSSHNHSKGGVEVTRAVSSKVTGQVVNFHHLSVFPVRLTTARVNQWWETDLIFKIYSRNSNQKKAVPIGKASHPLRCLLQNKQLSQSVVLPVQNMKGNYEFQEVGPLMVSVELTTDPKDLSSRKNNNKLASRDNLPPKTAPSPRRETRCSRQHGDTGEELPDEPRLNAWNPEKPTKDRFSQPDVHESHHNSWHWVEEEPEILLHTLLMVPDGRNFNCGPKKAPNVYLNCKLFCNEIARSTISWGQTDPSFNFVQVTPVALTPKLLERMQNNVIVIEVWQKTGSSGQDQLRGLVKLPLHQFYMSFRDPKIAQLLLQAQYPVLGVDCYMPVIDVFSGRCKGNLRIVLAMGQSEQIIALQRTRGEEYNASSHLVRPVHLLDLQPHSQTKVIAEPKEAMREHVFLIRVEKVNGLTPLQSTVWGEADCYVQYSFASQEADFTAEEDPSLIESSVILKLFRTTTTLCVPDPLFGHTETHVLLAPEGVPVQRLLLSCLSSQGLSSGGGVLFEVWCRYYYPNVRDQLVAKSILPLSKLCAMVTMQRQYPDDAHMFSLPLFPRTDCPTGNQPKASGLLDVCIRYKHRPVRPEGQTGKGVASRFVTLIVQVHRASGLQAAARLVSEQDESLCHCATVGVNPFITVHLSFLPENERKCTRLATRTFCPEFDHHMEVPCDLLLQGSSGETRSLAEQLWDSSVVFNIWNRDARKDVPTHRTEDVMLGTVKIPLTDLIHKTTGISGWFGVYLPHKRSSSQDQHILVGGIEINVRFAHHSDRERVIKAASDMGWEMAQNEVLDEDVWTESTRKMSFTFSMPRLWVPVHCLLLPGHSEVQRSTYCYFRYKFYDQDAFCSQMKHPSVGGDGEEGQATVAFQGCRTVELRITQPLMWYLREERLEVQVWTTFTKDKTQRPRDTDRLVGSAFIDLSSFAKISKQKLTVSGVYPLFRRSAADLQGAALRVHITLTIDSIPVKESVEAVSQMGCDSHGELLSEEAEEADQVPSPIPSKSPDNNRFSSATPVLTSVKHMELNLDESFPVTVAVDRAMHLNLKGCPLAGRSEGSPCCCVSYVTADSTEPASTAVMASTDCPVWDHQHQCRLSNQLLLDPQQSLVFKVWHKGEIERVIGFASVDLSPLLWGFQSVCGWYNITDFSGQCHGQLKVSITPLKGVQHLRGQRKSVNEESAKHTSTFPLSYHTTATYSSFPSHISQYTEQKISSPDHKDRLFSDRPSESDRHCEHMEKVRLHHQSLQEHKEPRSECSSSAGDINPSSSFLISTLRKKLSELDSIQRYFNCKLSTPTFPSMTEQDCYSSKHMEQGDPDNRQLLLKSNQLVGQVNNIITGGQVHLDQIPSNPQSSTASSNVEDNILQTIQMFQSQRASNSDREILHGSSPLPKMPDDLTDSESEEEEDGQSDKFSEYKNEEGKDKNADQDGCRQDKEDDDDDDDDDDDENQVYDEVVVEPRPLNEVTSLTDQTSPWTSVLSDPDLVSLESVEPQEEPNLIQDEKDEWKTLNLQAPICGEKHICGRGDESRSAGDASETDSGDDDDDARTMQTVYERNAKRAKSPHEDSSEDDSSPTTPDATDTHAPSSSLVIQDSPPQVSVHMEVPNFFLPSHQLEASMRALRLAPSFTHSPNDLDQTTLVHPRGPRQCPNMSPSSRKKETERIAKIFAAHFHNNK